MGVASQETRQKGTHMFSKMLRVMIVLPIMVMATSVVSAQEQSNDRITVKKSDLPPDLLKKIETENKIQTYGAWVGVGKEVGTAVNEGLSALTKNADDFAKTGVGKFTMLMIAWKVMGWHLVHIIFGTLFFVIGLVVFCWSWFLSGRTRRIKIGADEHGPKYQVVQPSEGKLLGYGIWFIAHIAVSSLIIFSA